MSIDSIARGLAASIKGGLPTVGLQSSLQGSTPIWDTFDRPDQPMVGSKASSGQIWQVTGSSSNAQLVNGQLTCNVSSGAALYCYQNWGSPITHAECHFNFTQGAGSTNLNTAVLCLCLDSGFGAIANFLHLNFGPRGWSLHTGAAVEGWTLLGGGSFNILTDGTVYRIAMDVNYVSNTVTVTAPDGVQTTFTNGAIGTTVVPSWCFVEIQPASTAFVGAYNGFMIGEKTLGATVRAANEAAPMEEIAWLKGIGGNSHQAIGSPTPINWASSTAGWYTIATASTGLGTYGMTGRVVLTATIPGVDAEVWAFDVNATSTNTAPYLAQVAGLEYSTPIVSQARLSTQNGSNYIQLDVYFNFSSFNYTLTVDFYGLFTPVPVPVVGATALSGGNTVITFGTVPLKNAYITNSSTSSSTALAASDIFKGINENVLNLTGAISAASNAALPSVASLIVAMSPTNPWLGEGTGNGTNTSFLLRIINGGGTGSGVWTITTGGDSNWTLNGAMTLAASLGYRDFSVTFTSATAATLQSLGPGTLSGAI